MIRAALLASLALVLPTKAAAQSFTTEEAARCGVVFARMADALAETDGAPDVLVAQVAVGLPVWEYELIASAPGQEEVLNTAVSSAIDDLLAGMPDGEGEASARGDYLLAQAQACGRMIDAAYPDARHPVVTELRERQAQAAVQAPVQVPVPSPKPDPDAPKQRKRGLR